MAWTPSNIKMIITAHPEITPPIAAAVSPVNEHESTFENVCIILPPCTGFGHLKQCLISSYNNNKTRHADKFLCIRWRTQHIGGFRAACHT